MKTRCPYCGNLVMINGFGRKPLNIGVNKVCDTLRRCKSVKAAAEQLRCSRGYIYQVLTSNGLDVKEFVNPNKSDPKKKY